MMELAGGGSLSDSLYKGVSAEGALGGRRTALGDVPCRVFAGRASDGRVVTYKRFLRSHEICMNSFVLVIHHSSKLVS